MTTRVFLFALLITVSCSPTRVSTNWESHIINIEDYGNIADKGILITSFQNDSLYHWESSTLTKSSIIQLGDLSQVFTANHIKYLVNEGVVNLNTSINQYLPTHFQFASLENVTVQDCLSHLAGFPRIPNNLGSVETNVNQPYENYTADHLKAYLATWQPTEKTSYQYSLIGYALLGIAFKEELESYATVDEDQILKGHNRIGNPVPILKSGIFEDAIGKKLTFNLLESLLEVWCSDTKSIVGDNLKPIAPTDIDSQTSIATGWHIYKVSNDYTLALHKGSAGGHSVFMGICPESKTGVVIAATKKVNLGPMGYYIMGQLNNGWKK